MKINSKIFNNIQSTPFDVQQLENGVVVELHSMNQNESLYNEYANKGKFAVWSSVDSKTYRLLIEDGFYSEVREFYTKRVNQCWIDFWDAIEKGRRKVMLTLFLPMSVIVFAVLVVLLILSSKKVLDNNAQLAIMGGMLVVFIGGNFFVNKKIDKIINTSNSIATEKIKNIVGHKKFEELLNKQRAYYDKFFNIPAEESAENANSDETKDLPSENVKEEVTENQNTNQEK